MTYAEWYGQYIRLYKRTIAPKTRESYARLSDLILPTLGSLDLESITPEDVQSTLIAVEEAAGSRQSQLAYALIRAVFRRAVRSRKLLWSPVDAIDRPAHAAEQGRAIEGDDWRILQPVIDDDLAFCLMARAGLRRGELLGLQWGDIDLQEGIIRVRRQLVRTKDGLTLQPPKSHAGVRDIPIEPQLLAPIRRDYRLAPSQRVIPCAPETLGNRWRRAQHDAGIAQPYRLHDLRHTYATRMILAGVNLRVLQYMIGHSSFELTVSTYAHIGPRAAVQEVTRVAASLH